MKHIFLLCAMSLGFLMGHAQEEEAVSVSVDDILNTYFENIGGLDNWKALTSIRIDGKMVQMGMEFPGVVTQVPPNKQHMDVNIQGQQLVQAYDGETAWWINPFMGAADAQPMPDEMAEEFKKETFEDSFIDYAKKGHTVEYTGDVEVDGVMCHELKLTKKDGTIEFHYFDPEYMIPIMVKTTIDSGQMKGQTVETYFSDYEEVEGLMMPKHTESRVGGATQFTLIAVNIEINVEVDESLFAFPGAAVEEEKK